MHILDDPYDLSERAREFLHRAGRREDPGRFEIPIEMWRVRDRAGRMVLAPPELIIRLEGFVQRYGGLRYHVRNSWNPGGEPLVWERGWEYDHYGARTAAWQDASRDGWCFEWLGQRVSKPCRELIHTNGSVGSDVDGSGPFVATAPSLTRLIESHAVTDSVADWRPWPMLVRSAADPILGPLDRLPLVPEASWDTQRWLLSDSVAVSDSACLGLGDDDAPRRRFCVWSRGEDGHRQVREALAAVREAER
ncbi:hypothetical protein [Streptomyces sp. NPDC048659]|uniref:hypothetical protein n=1 Tax=Streptomyces sp. NPDC048659 TaxID=3155489 RepID=UPI003412FAFD